MRRTKLIFAILAIILVCTALVFVACTNEVAPEDVHVLEIKVNGIEYNGSAIVPQIQAGNDEYILEWYSVSEAGELTALDEAPKNPGRYRVVAKLKNYEEISAQADFEISKAKTTVEISDLTKISDGDAVKAPTYTTNSDSTNVTIKYRSVEPETLWVDEAPSAPGKYEVRVIIAGNDNYEAADVTKAFTIEETPLLFDLNVLNSGIEVSFFASKDNKIIDVCADSEEAFFIKNFLKSNNAVGKSVEEVVNLAIEFFNDNAYLLSPNFNKVRIQAETDSLKTFVENTVKAKLQSLNLTSKVDSRVYDPDVDIRSYAFNCYLYEYDQDYVYALNMDALKIKLLKVRELSDSFQNEAVEALFTRIRAKEVLAAKLNYAKTQLQDNQAILTEIDGCLAELNSSFETFLSGYEDNYLSPQYHYPFYILSNLRENLVNAIKENKDQANYHYASVLSNYNGYYEYERDAQLRTLFNTYTDMYAELNKIANLNVIIQIDEDKIAKDCLDAFSSKYAKYINLNYYTGEGLFVEGEKIYYYASEQLNKTYYIATLTDSNHVPEVVGMTYEFDGIVAESDIYKTAPKRIYYATYLLDNSNNIIEKKIVGMGNEELMHHTFFEINNGIEVRMAEGDPISSIVVQNNCGYAFGPVTYVFTKNDSDEIKAYLYVGEYTKQEALALPCFDVVNCTIDSVTSTIRIDAPIGFPSICFEFDDQENITVLTAEAIIMYSTQFDLANSPYSNTIGCVEVNGEKIAYLTISNFFYSPGNNPYYYTLKGTWSIENDILTAVVNGVGYLFDTANDMKFIRCNIIKDEFTYNGSAVTPLVSTDDFDLEWYTVGAYGMLTKLDGAPKNAANNYRLIAKSKTIDCLICVADFKIIE